MNNDHTILVIFDYSGTLSLGSIRFGNPGYLMRRLEETHLVRCGVTGPDIFWHDIVTPTWHEGSTTSIGYTHLMVRQVTGIAARNAIAVSEGEIFRAAARFVDSYFAHSRIDSQWRQLLETLVDDPSVCVLIATDHYAEATGTIIRSLENMGLTGVSLTDGTTGPLAGVVKIANSADMGFHKADRRFWIAVKSRVPSQVFNRIVCIDDFGHNESVESDYSAPVMVEKRMHATVSILKDVFATDVVAIPFIIEAMGLPEREEDLMIRGMISKIALKVRDLRASGS